MLKLLCNTGRLSRSGSDGGRRHLSDDLRKSPAGGRRARAGKP